MPQHPYQGMYPAIPIPPMYHQIPPAPPPVYYQPPQHPPYPNQFPERFQAPQYDDSHQQFVPTTLPNAPPLEDPSIHDSDPINPRPNEAHECLAAQTSPQSTPLVDAALVAIIATDHQEDVTQEDQNKKLEHEAEATVSSLHVDPQSEALVPTVAALAITADVVELKAEEECNEMLSKQHKKLTYHGTIQPHQPFEPKQDAEALKKAFKGLGTDERAIINILANRTYGQRLEIASAYEAMYHRKLVKDLKSELSGHLKEISRALMMSRVRYYTKCFLVAFKGRGSLQRLLVEFYFTSTNAEIHEINEIFQNEFKTCLPKEIKRQAPGYFGHVIVAANYGTRDEKQDVDHHKVKADAEALINSTCRRWDRPDSIFTKMLIARTYSHLRQVFEEYSKITGHKLEKVLKMQMSGTLLDGMLLIVNCIENPVEFFAKRLHDAIKTLDNDDLTIIRIVATRSEIDLTLIKEAYLKKYKKTTGQHLFLTTDGDYKKVLLEILKTE